MKKHFLFAALAMTALFSACSNEEENLMTTGNEVNFVIGGVESRTTTTYAETGGYVTAFEDNDKIGIYSSNLHNTQMANELYKVNGTTLEQSGSTQFTYAGGETEATFKAYFPYAENNGTFTIKTDQSNADNFYDNDFMTAEATAKTGAVTLNFEHKLVLVELNFTGFEDGTKISTVQINNVKPTVSFEGTTATVGEATGDATNIAMFTQTADSRYWAIIPAQEIAAGTLFTVTLAESGDTYSFATEEATTFTAGKLVRYNLAALKQSRALVSVGTTSIDRWGETENDLVTESGDIIYDKEVIKLTFPTSVDNITSDNHFNRTSTSLWGHLGITINSITNEGGINFTSSTTENAWAKAQLTAYIGKLDTDKKYQITLNAKAVIDSEDTKNINLIVLQNKQYTKVADDNSKSYLGFYCAINGTYNESTQKYGSIQTFNLSKTSKDYTYTIEPGTLISGAGTASLHSEEDITAASLTDEFAIVIYDNQKTGTTFELNSIVVEEVVE